MGKRELIEQELGRLLEVELDHLLEFLGVPSEEHAEASVPMLVDESSLANPHFSQTTNLHPESRAKCGDPSLFSSF